MRQKTILITGAAGEVGHALVKQLYARNTHHILTLDVRALPPELEGMSTHIIGDILDENLFKRLITQYNFTHIFHLAALLSTRGELAPEAAHNVNVNGSVHLLQMAADQSEWKRDAVIFVFPSSVAVYGMQTLENKRAHPRPREWEWNNPITMYGCNKLYIENLGNYYTRHYKQLAEDDPTMLDFRSVRFPGLISAFTLPSGGTSDYGPEMIHAAAQGKPYACFVRPDTAIPFMAMPDAAQALINLADAPRKALTRRVYNITSFSITAEEIAARVKAHFPTAEITYAPHLKRQRIVDSWPIDMNDEAARQDWGWQPQYDLERTFDEYLIPNIRQRYQK